VNLRFNYGISDLYAWEAAEREGLPRSRGTGVVCRVCPLEGRSPKCNASFEYN
jgi:hypothetical protein